MNENALPPRNPSRSLNTLHRFDTKLALNSQRQSAHKGRFYMLGTTTILCTLGGGNRCYYASRSVLPSRCYTATASPKVTFASNGKHAHVRRCAYAHDHAFLPGEGHTQEQPGHTNGTLAYEHDETSTEQQRHNMTTVE